MKKLKGLIAINAYAESANTRQLNRFRDEFAARGVETDVKRNAGFPLCIADGKTVGDIDYDFCLFLDKDKYVAQMLEKRGIRLFNTATAIADCDDKMQTHIVLSDCGIPMPITLPAPLCYDKNAVIPESLFDEAERRLGYPVIVKLSYGSQGKGVFKADDRETLEKTANDVKLNSHLFQQYIAESHGRDMRVIVIGGKVVGGILRTSSNDFRSNIGLGGTAKRVDVPRDIRDIAVRAASVLGLDYCGIDFLLGKTPLLCEVNSNAFFDAFESATGINVAGIYAEHIISVMQERRQP